MLDMNLQMGYDQTQQSRSTLTYKESIMKAEDLNFIRSDIRDRFSDIIFPQPTIEPVFYGKKEKVLCPKNRAVVDYTTGSVMSIVSDKYTLVQHEDILYEALQEVNNLSGVLGQPDINIKMMNGGAKMVYTIHWPSEAKDIKKGDPVAPLFRGVNSYDTSTRMASEYGAMRLVCTNGMVVGHADSKVSRRHISDASPEWVRAHIAQGVAAFERTTLYLEKLADKMVGAADYEELWSNLPFSVKERQRIESLPLIGFDGDTLQNHITLGEEGLSGQVSAWMLQAALTQFNSHEMKGTNRSFEVAPLIGRAIHELSRTLEAA